MKIPGTSLELRRVLVYGLGLSGRAASRLLLDRGVAVLGVDARPADRLDLVGLLATAGFELAAGSEPTAVPAGVDAIVVSPGVPADRPLLVAARALGLPVLAEVELAFPFLDGPVVAVTGSNGKSTTTALAGAMLTAAGFDAVACGNLGDPLAAQVPRPGSEPRARRAYVVELSSFQLEAVDRFHPRAATLLNLSPDHLDRHGGMVGYATAKRRIFARQGADDVAVLNADDPWSAETPVNARRRLFSRQGPVADGCYLADDRVLETAPSGAPRELFRASDVPLAGAHNLENAMAAALLARALGALPEHLVAALRGFRGLPHRMEKVLEADGVTWYDDSKGTNPGATLGSLAGFPPGSVHLILGGRNKGSDFAMMAPEVAAKARAVYLIGEAADELGLALAGPLLGRVPVHHCGTLDRAVQAAAAAALPGEVVLLSPACASFDQFRDFNERGDVFQRLVTTLVGGAHAANAPV